MKINTFIALAIAKISRFFLKLTNHKATSLPGKLAHKIDPDILDVLSENTKFVFVTGTNGKTMTTHFLVSLLRRKYNKVFTNDSGSNMIQGIITSLLDNPSKENTIAVLEVDEANLVRITKFIKADYVIFTNIFRDQMDRFAEIYNVFNILIKGMQNTKDSTIIANGDLPIFSYDEMKEFKVKYYGIRIPEKTSSTYDLDPEFNSDGIICPKCHSILKYKTINYSSLGDFSCPNCDFKSPVLSYTIEKIEKMEESYSQFTVNGETYHVNVGGLYNIYNALAAISCAKELGLSKEMIYEGLDKQKNVFGRQESIKIGSKKVTINLVKNPTGLNQVIDLILLDKNPLSLICLLNDNYADGTDVSWIYDSYYEKLKNLDLKDVYVSGMRKKDMKRRLEIAEIFNGEIKEFDYENEVKDIILNTKTDNIYVLSTYTAMNRLREVLDLK
ncbi:MAG: MurT ligase domain-containing protein [Peptoniphilaceae bacterium]|nr:MurT ligase domain-containing protein [Peptoniphilaceae bacterium]MDY6018317.1 MurT ligase domain-containing protein [Anaerococcus sp.]